MQSKFFFLACLCLLAFTQCNYAQPKAAVTKGEPASSSKMELPDPKKMTKVVKSDEEWRALLGEEAYKVLRQGGTECAFTGAHWNNKENGVYLCAGCQLPLFESAAKFESGTGWPSFYQPIKKGYIEEKLDLSHNMKRIEITCARCGGHLGHVFDDGPKPTGLRYCVNSASLKFEKSQ